MVNVVTANAEMSTYLVLLIHVQSLIHRLENHKTLNIFMNFFMNMNDE